MLTPDSLPQWNFVDLKASSWGLRRYELADPEKDPTIVQFGLIPGETGFAFHIEEKGSVEIAYFSDSAYALEGLRLRWSDPLSQCHDWRIEEGDSGHVDIRLDGECARTNDQVLLMFLALLGHVLYLS